MGTTKRKNAFAQTDVGAGGEDAKKLLKAPGFRTARLAKTLQKQSKPKRDQDQEATVALRSLTGDNYLGVPEGYRGGLKSKGVPRDLRALYNRVEELGQDWQFLWRSDTPFLRSQCELTGTLSSTSIGKARYSFDAWIKSKAPQIVPEHGVAPALCPAHRTESWARSCVPPSQCQSAPGLSSHPDKEQSPSVLTSHEQLNTPPSSPELGSYDDEDGIALDDDAAYDGMSLNQDNKNIESATIDDRDVSELSTAGRPPDEQRIAGSSCGGALPDPVLQVDSDVPAETTREEKADAETGEGAHSRREPFVLVSDETESLNLAWCERAATSTFHQNLLNDNAVASVVELLESDRVEAKILRKPHQRKPSKPSLLKRQTTKLVLLPFCHSRHWTLAILDLIQMKLHHFDSANKPDTREAAARKNLILENLRCYRQGEEVQDSASFLYEHVECAQQASTSIDCGVFACTNALSFVLGVSAKDALDTELWRRLIYTLIMSELPDAGDIEELLPLEAGTNAALHNVTALRSREAAATEALTVLRALQTRIAGLVERKQAYRDVLKHQAAVLDANIDSQHPHTRSVELPPARGEERRNDIRNLLRMNERTVQAYESRQVRLGYTLQVAENIHGACQRELDGRRKEARDKLIVLHRSMAACLELISEAELSAKQEEDPAVQALWFKAQIQHENKAASLRDEIEAISEGCALQHG